MPITEYNAEAYFSIDAHSEGEAKSVLDQAQTVCDEALRKLNDSLPNGTRVSLSQEDEHGGVEVSYVKIKLPFWVVTDGDQDCRVFTDYEVAQGEADSSESVLFQIDADNLNAVTKD